MFFLFARHQAQGVFDLRGLSQGLGRCVEFVGSLFAFHGKHQHILEAHPLFYFHIQQVIADFKIRHLLKIILGQLFLGHGLHHPFMTQLLSCHFFKHLARCRRLHALGGGTVQLVGCLFLANRKGDDIL